MTDPNSAPVGALPSSRSLLRSTLIALATAAVLLVTAVLPAEYGVDPTGIGRVLGLTQMGEIKMQLAREAAAAEAAELAAARADSAPANASANAPATTTAPATATASAVAVPPAAQGAAADASAKVDAIHVTLQPGEAKEVKLVMRKGARVQYAWSTDR